MRSNKIPNGSQLCDLYEAAIEFNQLKPWQYLFEGNFICIENPRDKMIGYCSIMGSAGEHFALSVYLGDDGIAKFYQMVNQSMDMPSYEFLHYQNCLMCSFEDRDVLSNEDRKQIKELGLSFRGRNAWPMFRRYETGFAPWYLNEEECIFLTHALKQTGLMIEQLLMEQIKIDFENDKSILRFCLDRDQCLNWESKDIDLVIPPVALEFVQINDELLMERIKRAEHLKHITLQVETFYMLSTVQERKSDRPYFPRAFILADKHSGQIVDFEIYKEAAEDIPKILNKTIGFFLENGVPKEIQVKSEATAAILEELCTTAGVTLKIKNRLDVIEELKEEMLYRFN